MTNIDFLPAEYRQRSDDRRNRAWRMSVFIVFGLMVAGTALFQHTLRRRAELELAEVKAQYDVAIVQSNHLNESQAQLRTMRGKSDLYTLLDHPWSRTRILQAVLETLPEEATLSSLQINRDSPPTRAAIQRNMVQRTFGAAKDEQKALQHLLPEERDQQQIREKLNATQTIVVMSGTTRDQRAIHDYIGRLERNDLFVKAEITSIEQARSDPTAAMLFAVRLVVRPAYGLTGGPTGSRIEDPRPSPPNPRSPRSKLTTASHTEVAP